MYKIPANTVFMGQRLIFVPECQSTNTLLSELAAKSVLPEGTVVITANQTAGRGQRGNTWHVEPGQNLTFSILLKPHFLPAKKQFELTMMTSLCIHEYLTKKNVGEIKIKWPNDILINKKKVCGMLIENVLQDERIEQSVVGIGLNINQKNFSFGTATSLSLETQSTFDLREELPLLLAILEKKYSWLREQKTHELKNEYLKNLYGYRHQISFFWNGKKRNGSIKDVDAWGRIIVQSEGELTTLNLKEITFDLTALA